MTYLTCEAALALAWAYEQKQRIRALTAQEQRQRRHMRKSPATILARKAQGQPTAFPADPGSEPCALDLIGQPALDLIGGVSPPNTDWGYVSEKLIQRSVWLDIDLPNGGYHGCE